MTFDGDAFANSELSAHILGDCSICGSALTPAIVTAHSLDTDEEVARYELLVCSADISHYVMSSDAHVYHPHTTADQT